MNAAGRLCAAVVFSTGAFGQSPVPPQDISAALASGREFTGKLSLDQQADTRLFREVGFERAKELLSAVMNRGQDPAAGAEDWQDMHRATSGLIELYIEKGELFRASIFASAQSGFYRDFERDYGSALKASQLALDLHRQSGVKGNLNLSLSTVGRAYLSLGQPGAALPYFKEAQGIAGEPTKLAGQNWRDVVLAEIALQRRDEAQGEVERFLAAARGAPTAFRAEAYMAQSDSLIDQRRFDDALNAIKTAREIVQADPTAADWFAFEDVNQLMICILASMENTPYPDAIALAKRIDKEFPGLPINIPAFAQQAITVRRRLAGEIDAVLREQTETLQQARAAGSVPAQIEILRGMAATYAASNSVGNQIAALEQALEMEKTMLTPDGLPSDAGNAYSYFALLNLLGDAYIRSHETGKARRSFNKVTRVIDALPAAISKQRAASAYGEAILGKAAVAEVAGDVDSARDFLEGALHSDGKGPARFAREEVLLQTARLERNVGEKPALAAQYYAAAIAAYQEKRNQRREVAVRLEYAHLLSAHAASVPDALRLAGRQIAEARSQAETIQFADAQWRVEYESGFLAEAQSQEKEAIERYRVAIARLDQIRAGLSQQELRQALLDNNIIQDVYQRIIGLLVKEGSGAEAWQYVERAKARSFLETLKGHRFHTDDSRASPAEVADLEKRIIDLHVQLSPENEQVLRGADKEPAVLQSRLRDLERRFLLARQQAQLGATRAGQVLAIEPISLDQVRKLLPPRTALIEYALLNDRVAAFVVKRDKWQLLSWSTDTAVLRKDVLQLRSLLADQDSGGELTGLLAKVSKALLAPVEKAFLKGTEQLIIVPNGVLNYLPFQVLSTGSGRLLAERFAITYLPSASSLQFLQNGGKLSRDLFLGALGRISVEGRDPLPGTLRETDSIAKVYPNAVRASEKDFTHARAKAALLEHSVVHFATHGVLDEQAPLFSALLTVPAPGEPSRLSLYEITSMPLRARLVVLSACDTGLGKLLAGDEVSSITRTFLLAGANAVVSSLWQVNDDSTALLMQGFYKRLHAGQMPSRAIREAALKVREKYPHPFFWAPFIVTGVQWR